MKRSTIALALILTAATAFGQVKQAGAGAITGFVTTVSGNLITLLNGAVAIDTAGATFHNRKGTATIADVKPGMQIAVAIRNTEAGAGTMLQASTVVILDSPAGSLTGPVQSVDLNGSTLTIFGARVQVTANTRINSSLREANLSLAGIKAGDIVTVEVNIAGSALIAESIYVFAPPAPKEASVQGTVKSIGATAWVITTRDGRDVRVIVTSNTKIDPTLKTGDSAIAVGTADAAGTITATAIYANTPKTVSPSEVSLTGTVKSMGQAAWVITTGEGKDVTVAVTASTKIDPTLKTGDTVNVIGRTDASGNVTALAITRAEVKRRSAGR